MLHLSDRLNIASTSKGPVQLDQRTPTSKETTYSVVVKAMRLLLDDKALTEACLGAKMSTSRSITDKWEHLGKSTRNEELKRLSQGNIGAAFAGLPRQSMKKVFNVDADDIEPTIEKGMQMTEFKVESNDFPLREDLEKFLEHTEGPDALQIKKILKKYETAAGPA